MSEKVISTECIVPETIRLSRLTIESGGSIVAPDGKYVTLTVDGIGREIMPGEYRGDLVLTVSDDFVRTSSRFGMKTTTHFRSGVLIDDGQVIEASAVSAIVRGGEVTGQAAKGVRIESHEWDFNGFYITGASEYTIEGAEIELHGDGTDDFVGRGAGIAASGDAVVTINDTKIRTYGITRGAVFVGGNSVVTANDCDFSTESYVPTEAQREEGKKLDRMMKPPWMMGIKGNGRTTNTGQMGAFTLNRCHVTSNNWGALSIDGAIVNRMYVNDCLIEVTGESGYGMFTICDDFTFDYKAYGDYGCFDIADHSTFNIPDYALIMSLGNAGGEFRNGCVVNSRRWGAIIFRNSGGLFKINSKSVFNTGLSTVIVKGANASIEMDDCVLNPGNGVILSLIDNDDTGLLGGDQPYPIPLGETDVRDESRDLTVADPSEDVFLMVSNMDAAGDIFNATTNLKANCRVKPMPFPGYSEDDKPDFGDLRGLVGEDLQGVKNLDVKLRSAKLSGVVSAATVAYRDGLTEIGEDEWDEIGMVTHTTSPVINNGVILDLDADSAWAVTGTSYLTSLTFAKGARITAPKGKSLTMTVDGVEAEIVPGIYKGAITLEVA
jgi:hypothetical protein